MASSSHPKNNIIPNVSSPSTYDPTTLPTNTTFVQADPTTFRAVVQKLTGAPHDPAAPKLPISLPARLAGKSPSGDMGPRRPPFKLHERRQSGGRKLEIKLNRGGGFPLGSRQAMVSPVSTLDAFARGSPRTPRSPVDEEERAIAEKGFYLHRSPLSTPRGKVVERGLNSSSVLTLIQFHPFSWNWMQ
ncbi:hypothetical protein RHGRI_024807 [Rhododendron griersonianum]|uniref:VQ domain-containing protein n=1 Tax=Rhododendron griersonianum TaxID=479676 RepID=A0AAV6JBA8_9ERIC|nr:hypothetical protein RHGRI_024807 [Rhododendron griersonianum]